MSRIRRANNLGMCTIRRGPQRPYGKCPRCKQLKPMYWVSKTRFSCYTCLKKSGKKPYSPTLKKGSRIVPFYTSQKSSRSR